MKRPIYKEYEGISHGKSFKTYREEWDSDVTEEEKDEFHKYCWKRKSYVNIAGLAMDLVMIIGLVIMFFVRKSKGVISVLPDTEITNEAIADVSTFTWIVVFLLLAVVITAITKLICNCILKKIR